MKKNIVKTFVGFLCLPTNTKMNPAKPELSNGFAPNQITYILESSNPEDLKGGPFRVALTTFSPLENEEGELLQVGDDIKTQHAQQSKQLPSRKIIGVIFEDGKTKEGVIENASLPHWELMVPNEVTAEMVQARLDANRARKAAPKKEDAQKSA